jgi:hypothetical protein
LSTAQEAVCFVVLDQLVSDHHEVNRTLACVVGLMLASACGAGTAKDDRNGCGGPAPAPGHSPRPCDPNKPPIT